MRESPNGPFLPNGGGGGDPDAHLSPKPCNIPDPAFSFLNTASYSSVAQVMWDASNGDAIDYRDRLETVGVGFTNNSGDWTMQVFTNPNFYKFRTWDTAKGPAIPASSLPDDGVHIHTHPFRNGDLYREGHTGRRVKYEYQPSKPDSDLLEALEYERGVFLDQTHIVVFGHDQEVLLRVERCGY